MRFPAAKALSEDIDADVEDNDDGEDELDDAFDPINQRISPIPGMFLDEPGAGETPWEGMNTGYRTSKIHHSNGACRI